LPRAKGWEAIAKLKEHAMRSSQTSSSPITTIGIDTGKNTFHLKGKAQQTMGKAKSAVKDTANKVADKANKKL
jgi:hypothetical protein